MTSENFVAIPRSAVIHIQKSAPGPPQWMAHAAPAMLPIPTVADSAVVRAWKCETSPGSLGSSYRPLVTAKPWAKWRSWTKPSRTVRKMPVPSRAITLSGIVSPLTGIPKLLKKSFTALTTCSSASIGSPKDRNQKCGKMDGWGLHSKGEAC